MCSRQVPIPVTETSERIARAAADLFVRNGYRGTSMAAIATEAGVAVQTLYNVAGSKAAVLGLVLDRTVSGPEAPRSVPEFMEERVRHLQSQADVIDALSDWFAEVHPRSSALFKVIRDGAAIDAEVAGFQEEREKRRLANYRRAAARIADRGPTRLNTEETAALIWAVGHPDVYRQLVVEEGWPPEHYRSWMRNVLAGAIQP